MWFWPIHTPEYTHGKYAQTYLNTDVQQQFIHVATSSPQVSDIAEI